jgi:hypothetical protein
MSSQPQHFPDPVDAGRPPDHPAYRTHGAFCIDARLVLVKIGVDVIQFDEPAFNVYVYAEEVSA